MLDTCTRPCPRAITLQRYCSHLVCSESYLPPVEPIDLRDILRGTCSSSCLNFVGLVPQMFVEHNKHGFVCCLVLHVIILVPFLPLISPYLSLSCIILARRLPAYPPLLLIASWTRPWGALPCWRRLSKTVAYGCPELASLPPYRCLCYCREGGR